MYRHKPFPSTQPVRFPFNAVISSFISKSCFFTSEARLRLPPEQPAVWFSFSSLISCFISAFISSFIFTTSCSVVWFSWCLVLCSSYSSHCWVSWAFFASLLLSVGLTDEFPSAAVKTATRIAPKKYIIVYSRYKTADPTHPRVNDIESLRKFICLSFASNEIFRVPKRYLRSSSFTNQFTHLHLSEAWLPDLGDIHKDFRWSVFLVWNKLFV